MKAMIMAAGVGSRLMPLTMNIPKPMIPMGNRPLMENTVQLLAEHGFNELIANLYYHASVITDYFSRLDLPGISLNFSVEDELLGTAGGVKKCQWFLDDTFVVMSGDALTDIDLTRLLDEHRKRGSLATIALKKVEDVQNFGVVEIAEDGLIRKFQEKPRPEEAISHSANTGIYIFEPEIFRYIPENEFYDFGKQVFPYLVEIGSPFYGVEIDDYWCDVGNIDTYRDAHSDILNELVKIKASGELVDYNQGRVLLGENTYIGKDVKFGGQVVIGNGCRIGDGACIIDSVIWNNCVLEENTCLKQCVVGDGCRIGAYTVINPGAAVGSGCCLEKKVEIKPSQKVFSSPEGWQLKDD